MVLLALGVVALICSYAFLPSLAGGPLGEGTKNEPALQATPDAGAESEPSARPASTVGEGRIPLDIAEFGGVRLRNVTIDLDPFELNVSKSIREGELASKKPLSGDLRMEIPEKEVSRIAGSASGDVSVEGVDLEKDRVTVETETRFLGLDVPVAVRGGLEIRDQALVFEPRRVSAFGVRLPEGLAEEVISQAAFSYPLEDLPYEADITGVEVKKDYLVLSGRLERISLGGAGG